MLRIQKHSWKDFLLLLSSGLLTLLVVEASLRLFSRFPIHGRMANRVADAVLGYRMDPSSPGIDPHGFRNANRPSSVDVVVLGDSHTFGYNVASEESFPRQLAQATGRSVYNMGVGGYGAYHYRALLDEALSLRPRVVIAAVYALNDASDACGSRDYVTDHRAWERFTGVAWATCGAPATRPSSESAAEWTSSRSALISLVRWAYGEQRMRRILRGTLRESARDLVIADALGGRYYFRASTTEARAQLVDVDDPRVGIGAAQLDVFVEEADRRVRASGGRFAVLLVPIRERVFASLLAAQGHGPLTGPLLSREAALRARLIARLTARGIPVADAFDEMSAAQAAGQRVYPDGEDDHPVAAGYRAYAQAVERMLPD
jgi:hypothetical protein